MILNNSSDVMMAKFITKKWTGSIFEYTSFDLIELCLEGNKSEVFLISLENEGQF